MQPIASSTGRLRLMAFTPNISTCSAMMASASSHAFSSSWDFMELSNSQRSLQVFRTSKPDGGTRPIGWYLALFRLWAKARGRLWRDWENASGEFNMFGAGGHRKVTDIVWRQAIRAAIGAMQGKVGGWCFWIWPNAMSMLITCFSSDLA